MNILFTNYCNLSCPYCFAAPKLNPDRKVGHKYISLSDLGVFLDFCKNSSQTHIGILGGEPTLHPYFIKAVKAVMDSGIEATIFSNGIIADEEIVAFLKDLDSKKYSLTININSERTYGKREYSLLQKNLKILHNKIVPGFNIYEEDFEADFLIGLIKKYDLQRAIRLSMASPIIGHSNRYIPLEKHKTIAHKIVKFAGKCDESDIVIAFDCGFTLCSFSEEECGKLQYYNSPLAVNGCAPIIDVSWDLSVWRCFSTSALWNRKLTEFKDLKEIQDFFENKFRKFKSVGATKNCVGCKYLRRNQCSGVCLAYTLKSFNVERLLAKTGYFS